MIGKIYNWDQEEQLAIFQRKEETCQREENIFIDRNQMLWCKGKIWEDFELDTTKVKSGDILEISDTGIITVVYSAGVSEIDIFVTNKCNSNCVMCPLSESARRKTRQGQIEWIKKYIKLLPQNISYINVTGGEPTLAGEDFYEIMSLLREKFQHSGFQLLTNGRSLADKKLLERMLSCLPAGIRFAIPFHCASEKIHDEITCSKGSFRQTVQGVHNLLHQNLKVEIRIVVSRKNVDYLSETAAYIIQHFRGIFCVNFIAMEMMGNAAKNRDELWEDYPLIFQKARTAITALAKNGIDVQLYNFPLCAVEKGFWHIAVKSITDYKIRYMEDCESCSVKSICGGFFYSTKQLMHPEVWPVKDEYEI